MSSHDCLFRIAVVECSHPVAHGPTDDARCSECEHRRVPRHRPTLANVATYLTAEASLALHGPVPDEVFDHRVATCRGCDLRADGETPDSVGYCRSCNCGEWARSRLSVKLTMPAAFCPRGKWQKHGNAASRPQEPSVPAPPPVAPPDAANA